MFISHIMAMLKCIYMPLHTECVVVYTLGRRCNDM